MHMVKQIKGKVTKDQIEPKISFSKYDIAFLN